MPQEDLNRWPLEASPVQVAALDGLGFLYFAWNRMEECEEVLARLKELHDDNKAGPSFALRWSLIARVRLLLERGELTRALDITSGAIARGISRGDKHVVASLSMLQAEAYARINRLADGSKALFRSISYGGPNVHHNEATITEACASVVRTTDETFGLTGCTVRSSHG